jgi:hypothetical protein
MSTSNNTRTSWRRAAVVAVFLLMLGVIAALGPRGYAQTQAQPDAQTKLAKLHEDAPPDRDAASADSLDRSATPNASEVPAAVAKELEAMKARIEHVESQLTDLAAFVAPPTTAAVRPARSAPTEVTLTGTVSCGHCQGIQPLHKGYTQFSWALYSVSQGDDIVLVVRDKDYKLQGDKNQLLKFMSGKARVTGRLAATALEVETIGRATKNE